jgi:hypothetical protein
MHGVVPRLSETPGKIRHAGHGIGDDTFSVLERLLGLDRASLVALARDGAIYQSPADGAGAEAAGERAAEEVPG